MRISDWSSDVCSSDLGVVAGNLFRPIVAALDQKIRQHAADQAFRCVFGKRHDEVDAAQRRQQRHAIRDTIQRPARAFQTPYRIVVIDGHDQQRSEEHTSELQSLMRISYAVFCLKKNKNKKSEKQE